MQFTKESVGSQQYANQQRREAPRADGQLSRCWRHIRTREGYGETQNWSSLVNKLLPISHVGRNNNLTRFACISLLIDKVVSDFGH